MAPSRSFTLFQGRVVTGPYGGGLGMSLVLLVGPTVVFFVFTAPFYTGGLAVLPALAGIVFLTAVCALFKTAFSDPGILPRAPEEAGDDPFSPLKRVVHVRGKDIESKFCHTCHIYKPPRCTHCSICNNCVDKFDHHCPWTANCIGRRNYRFFLVFVYSVTVYALAIVGLSLGHFISVAEGSFVTAISVAPVSFALIIYAFGAFCTIGFLAQFHCQLVAMSETTNEKLTYKYLAGNPFKKNILEEFRSIWFGPHTTRWNIAENLEQQRYMSAQSSVAATPRDDSLPLEEIVVPLAEQSPPISALSS